MVDGVKLFLTDYSLPPNAFAIVHRLTMLKNGSPKTLNKKLLKLMIMNLFPTYLAI